MELAHNLTLNEEVVKTLPEEKRSVFIFEWLQFLDKVLSALNRVRVIPVAFATSFLFCPLFWIQDHQDLLAACQVRV